MTLTRTLGDATRRVNPSTVRKSPNITDALNQICGKELYRVPVEQA